MGTEAPPAFQRLQSQVDEWVDRQLPSNYPQLPWPKADDTKVIREAIHGYQVLEPWEYLILDTPIVQRLRYIHQTALAYLVYPTATHTRFDHSLGVASVAQDFAERLLPGDRNRLAELRLAAFLHDVGHCLFSHLSESLMEQRFESDYLGARTAPCFAGRKKHLGEIISYMIVTSPRFAQILRMVLTKYRPGADPDNIAKLIIGSPSDNLAYLGDIITGPFDADKLDYLVRDCYFSGIRADVDVPRVILSSAIVDRTRFSYDSAPRDNMVMLRAGVSNLEQVIINKMLLFPSIYHHHKVRAIECMIRGIFELVWESPERILRHTKLRFQTLTDFLDVSEHDFFALGSDEAYLSDPIRKLLNRDLLERCLVVSMDYIASPGANTSGLFKVSTEDHPDQIRRLRELMWEHLPRKWRTNIHELGVDLPKRPAISSEVEACFVDAGTKTLATLPTYFPYPRWVESYQERRWKGHVFYVARPDHRLAAQRAAHSVFRDVYRVHRWNPAAVAECKLG